MNPDDVVDQTIRQARVSNVEFKAALLLILMIVLIVGSAAYLLYARGVFEPTQELVLIADDSEGVVVGMDMTFSGFPIGRVRRIELGEDGNARIIVDVSRKDAHWLRETSVFTMERSLVGATRIRAFTGVFEAPPLADGAERQVLKGDAMAEIPRLVSSVRDLLDNLNRITAEQSPLSVSLRHVQTATETLNSPRGALGLLMGNDADRARLLQVLDETNALLARLEAVAGRTETLIGNADQRVFGDAGLMTDMQTAVQTVESLLSDARQSLQKVDAVLVEVQGIAVNTRTATVDLDVLRAEVEASLRKVESLVNDINRRWPFARDTELKLP
ncbi:MlaD family protein [Tepidicella baoligensis]|uniref:MlaD family protein n=1 Tax=Tepidicella baoligensis TaxID=2707016 RepID=UPI0015D9B3C1|nr:MlaD family protein [Tepidicella baoligensis]